MTVMTVMTNVTCKNCGWVHMAYSRAMAEDQVANFNRYFYSLSTEQQEENYGGHPSDIAHYEHCQRCHGSYRHFRLSLAGDCPDGCTISPVLHFDEP
jgi:hypothetical protein